MEHQEENIFYGQLLRMVKSGLRACPMGRLPEGNSTTHPFPLSIHGAWMLQRGIEGYVCDTPGRSGDVNDCLVRYDTATTEATKLRDWLAEVDPDYLKFNIETLGILLKEMEAEKERLLDAQDQG